MKRMNRIWLFLLVAISPLKQKGQTITVGSLYNYSVGDTIIYSHTDYDQTWYSSKPPDCIYDIITQKTFSQTNDTIFYVINRIKMIWQLTNQWNYTKIYTTNTVSLVVTNLNSTATNFTLSPMHPCQNQSESTVVNSCGKLENYKVAVKNSGYCFEPPTISCKIIEGVGMFRTYRSGVYPYYGFSDVFVGCHKFGEAICGSFGGLSLGLTESFKSSEIEFKVCPNPSSGNCNIQLPETESGKNHQLQLKNSLGQVLLKQDLGSELNYQLPTHQFAPGIYFLSVYTDGKMVGENKLIISN